MLFEFQAERRRVFDIQYTLYSLYMCVYVYLHMNQNSEVYYINQIFWVFVVRISRFFDGLLNLWFLSDIKPRGNSFTGKKLKPSRLHKNRKNKEIHRSKFSPVFTLFGWKKKCYIVQPKFFWQDQNGF